jgi:DNA-binding NtrC family response regulator
VSHKARKTASESRFAQNNVESANVTVYHIGPQDQDLRVLADIVDQTDWKLCPDTRWRLATTESLPSAATQLNSGRIPIVLCERDSAAGSWKDMLESLRQFSVPPLLIVTSRTADEYLWAEALNLGAYDVLAKPYHAPEVVRVLSMAWLHWMHRRTAPRTLAQAS